MNSPARQRLDLRGTPCPLNYIRTRLALEQLPAGVALEVWLDRGEPERMVSEGLRHEGHAVTLTSLGEEDAAVQLTVHPRVSGADG